jgi:hypothetical protein
MVYLRRMRIHIWDIWRSNIWCVYVVYVWTWSKCEDMELNICLNSYPHIYSMSIHILRTRNNIGADVWGESGIMTGVY